MSWNAFPPRGLKIVKDPEILLDFSEQIKRQMAIRVTVGKNMLVAWFEGGSECLRRSSVISVGVWEGTY